MIFRTILKELMETGKKVSPRGLEIIELENYSYELQPYERFMSFPDRKLSLNYIKQEFLWYLRGDRFDTSITQYASMWQHLMNEDGSINSNYGQYIFGGGRQFANVFKILSEDKDSRRGSIIILSQEQALSKTKDVPCTYALNFRIRENKLNMTVHMRSQDSIFGMGNDAPAFSFIHEMMYNYLKITYPEIEYGIYHHVVDSFHIYEKHYEMAKAIIAKDNYVEIECPKISGPLEAIALMKQDFEDVPDQYQFIKWLLRQ